MGEVIKSAREISMEKVAKLGDISPEERLKWKYTPEGEKVAALYMKEEANPAAELVKFPENARKYVKKGMSDILIRNISLPRNEGAKRNTKRAMDGLKIIKGDKVAVENAFSKIRRVFEHYAGQGEQQRRQAYQQVKMEFTARLQQAAQKQMGSRARIDNIDVEAQPQFQEEWRRAVAQLETQYTKLLDEYKQELESIS